MHTEFYERLDVVPTASHEEIKKAYRKMAVKWHPDKHIKNKKEAKEKFQRIAEAYDTLSEPDKRKLYDKYGKDYKGIGSGQSSAAFIDPFKMFDEIFKGGSLNNYGLDDDFDLDFEVPDILTQKKGFHSRKTPGRSQTFVRMNKSSSGGMNSFGDQNQGSLFDGLNKHEPINAKTDKMTKEISCSLQEVYKGCNKNILYTKVLGSKQVKETLNIPISPGLKEGAKITYNGKGNVKDGESPGDVEFIFKIKKHPIFEWKDNDLIVIKKISFYDALKGFTTTVNTLDGKELNLKVPVLRNSSYEHVCKGYGMPIRKDCHNYGHGDLRIKFAIALPTGPIRKEILGLL
jgi:DnaJ homolog subfamily B member 4